MRTLLLSIICVTFPLINFAQTHFEDGYFIDDNGNKIEVLIKNLDWHTNPKTFEYKFNEESETKILSIENTREVGIPGKMKFIKHLVKIRQLPNRNMKHLSQSRQPVFTSETVFLKSLVEGKASLYVYTQANQEQYYYSLYDIQAEPLVYHKYLTPNNTIAENNDYKQTLFNFLQCDDITLEDLEKLKYQNKSLVNFFVKYNECSGSDIVKYKKSHTKFIVNLNARLGANFASMKVLNNDLPADRLDTDFGNQISLQFGIEAEFVLPFTNQKWAVILEPTYQYYKVEAALDFSQGYHTRVDYSSLDIPVGIRHFFYLDENYKLFVNGSFVMALDMNSLIYRGNIAHLSAGTLATNIAFGGGLKYNNRFSIEARYSTKRDIFTNYMGWSTDYSSIAIILGYTFL